LPRNTVHSGTYSHACRPGTTRSLRGQHHRRHCSAGVSDHPGAERRANPATKPTLRLDVQPLRRAVASHRLPGALHCRMGGCTGGRSPPPCRQAVVPARQVFQFGVRSSESGPEDPAHMVAAAPRSRSATSRPPRTAGAASTRRRPISSSSRNAEASQLGQSAVRGPGAPDRRQAPG